MSLFIGQSHEFFELLRDLAEDADEEWLDAVNPFLFAVQ